MALYVLHRAHAVLSWPCAQSIAKWLPVLCGSACPLGPARPSLQEPLWLALSTERRSLRHSEQYPTFGQPFLPRDATFGIELAFLGLLFVNVGLHVFAKGRAFFTVSLNATHVVLLALALGDTLVAGVTTDPHFRLAPFFRMAILAFFMKGLPSQVCGRLQVAATPESQGSPFSC